MTYNAVVVTRRGGPEVLRVVEQELRPPTAGQVRVRVPILEAAAANALLESGQVVGNVVLTGGGERG